MEKEYCTMGQQECFILSAFFASGLVFGFYKCVQRLSCLLLKFIQIQGGGGAGLELLKAVLVASRMETRS